jgi:hypothetical protein
LHIFESDAHHPGRVLRKVASNVWAADRPFLWNGIDVGAAAETLLRVVQSMPYACVMRMTISETQCGV